MALLFLRQLGIGAVVGAAVGWLRCGRFAAPPLATGGLYPVASLAVAALAFGGADALPGSGFLAVYLAGLALGTVGVPARQPHCFHEGLAWVGAAHDVLLAGLLVFPSRLDQIALRGTALALVLVFVSRPVAVAIVDPALRFTWADRALSAAGLRGAVPVVLATFPVIAGVAGAPSLRHRLLRGAALDDHPGDDVRAAGAGARTRPRTSPPCRARSPRPDGPAARRGDRRVPGRPDDAVVGARVRDLGLPREAVVNVIVRGDEAIPPRGSTILRAGDRLHVLLRSELGAMCTGSSSAGATARSGRRRARARRLQGRPPIFTVAPFAQVR